MNNKPPKSKGWTAERRARQAEIIRRNRPWEKSTGPRTEEGKAHAALNSLKHGLYTKDILALRRALRHHRQFLKQLSDTSNLI
jgi:hypothetical protein